MNSKGDRVFALGGHVSSAQVYIQVHAAASTGSYSPT
jgi:hypothetical protein